MTWGSFLSVLTALHPGFAQLAALCVVMFQCSCDSVSITLLFPEDPFE